MDLVKEMQKWKTDLDDLGVEKGKAEGRLEQAMAALKAAGFSTIDEARAELARRIAAKEKAEADARLLLDGFKEKYKDHIEV